MIVPSMLTKVLSDAINRADISVGVLDEFPRELIVDYIARASMSSSQRAYADQFVKVLDSARALRSAIDTFREMDRKLTESGEGSPS